MAGARIDLVTLGLTLAACSASHSAPIDGGTSLPDASTIDARRDGRADGGPDVDAGPSTADFVARRNRVYCDHERRCEPSREGSSSLPDLAPFLACHPSSRHDTLGDEDAIDPLLLAACTEVLERLETTGCELPEWPRWDEWMIDFQMCLRLHPAVDGDGLPPGAPCAAGDRCAGDFACMGEGCGRRCRPLPTLGEPCERRYQCAYPFECADRTDPPTCAERTACLTTTDCHEGVVPAPWGFCVDGRCMDEPTVGTICDGTDSDPCGSHLRCDGGFCQPLRAEGESCGVLDCADGLWCPAGVCVAQPGLGDACGFTECASEAPYCVGVDWSTDPDTAGTCSTEADGAPCSTIPTRYWGGCPPDYACEPGGSFSRCRPRALEGEACDAGHPCREWLACSSGSCRRVVREDEACSDVAVCPAGFVCRDERCAPWPMLGEVCDDELRCLEGACVAGRCAYLPYGAPCELPGGALGPWRPCELACREGTCAFPPALGEACDARRPCASGLECDDWPSGVCVVACAR